VKITIGAGALAMPTTITIAKGTSSVPGAIGQVWELGPSGTQFAKPVTITFSTANVDLGGFPATSVVASTVVGNAWHRLDQPTLDTTAQIMTGQTTHLSPYALATTATPLPPNGSNCPAFQPAAGDSCVAGTSCTYLNKTSGGQRSGVNDFYCGPHGIWEGYAVQDNAYCPETSAPGGACSTSYTPSCAYHHDPDCLEQCTCGQAASGSVFSCQNSCQCAPVPANDPSCNGTSSTFYSSGNNCPSSAEGLTCTEYCQQIGCKVLSVQCVSGQWTSAAAQPSTLCTK
ncbi:MAG: hypothetical protein ACREJ3_04155, partial [Polyangiaceae bacterium]